MGLALNNFKSLLLKYSVKQELYISIWNVYYNIEFFGPPI